MQKPLVTARPSLETPYRPLHAPCRCQKRAQRALAKTSARQAPSCIAILDLVYGRIWLLFVREYLRSVILEQYGISVTEDIPWLSPGPVVRYVKLGALDAWPAKGTHP
jgi:hypothetical protein